MSTPPIEQQPGRHLIPHGTRRVVIFDTNAYRVMTAKTSLADCRAKVLRLRQCEQGSGVFVLASPTVIWELIAHLDDPNDPAREHCLISLVVLGEHALDPAKPDGGISLFPDADSTVCRELFHALPPNHEQGIQNLGSLVKYFVKNAPNITDATALKNVHQIATNVAATEKQWLSLMQSVLAHCDHNVAKQFFGKKGNAEVRKQVRDFFASSVFMEMWATFMVEIHAKKVGQTVSSVGELKNKAKIMLEVFPVPFHLMSVLLQKMAIDKSFNLGSPRKKRWNFVWDSQLGISIGASHEIAGVPVFFVTGDGELIEAAKAAKCDSRVLSLGDYLNGIGFS
jgi:hypothetical protein